MFSCGGMLFTSQIIIYETTNIIENHISSKPICVTWNGGRAVRGVHNIDGTAAVVFPGRNNTAWDVTDHAIRYTPTGTPTVEWYEGVTLIGTGTDVTVCPATTTTYTAKLISCGTEVATDDVVVTVNPDPVIDAGVDEEICDDETTTYHVMYMDPYGCSSSDTVLVLVNYSKRIGVPSAFSPNGDGNNDVLFVKGQGIVGMSFQVFNRYGELVFQSDDQRIGWDGTYKNRDENPGVFTWVIYFTFEDGELRMLKGNTTLIR